MDEPKTVFFLIVHHEHGQDASAHLTSVGMQRRLMQYVTEWWHELPTSDPMPTDPEEAIEAYFQLRAGEWYSHAHAKIEE